MGNELQHAEQHEQSSSYETSGSVEALRSSRGKCRVIHASNLIWVELIADQPSSCYITPHCPSIPRLWPASSTIRWAVGITIRLLAIVPSATAGFVRNNFWISPIKCSIIKPFYFISCVSLMARAINFSQSPTPPEDGLDMRVGWWGKKRPPAWQNGINFVNQRLNVHSSRR